MAAASENESKLKIGFLGLGIMGLAMVRTAQYPSITFRNAVFLKS